MDRKPTVVIAGANGFVGQALIKELQPDFNLIALSRSEKKSSTGVEWRACDLFSMLQSEQAINGADYAVYLVHSMLPAKLTQARFEDMDFILADNFARAAAKSGVKQIVYLGGLIPRGSELSRHLASRLEVEQVLEARGVPVTSLRAGLIIGAGGSSFRIMLRLVQRLPAMLCPKWTQSRTQPVALRDVIRAIRHVIGNEKCHGKALDLGGPDRMTYIDMMQTTAVELFNKPRFIRTVPLLSAGLSVAWVRMVTGAHRELIKPLVQSLRHEMLATESEELAEIYRHSLPFREALHQAVEDEKARHEPRSVSRAHLARTDRWSRSPGYVVSIQRLPLPPGCDGRWVAREYARWLPTLLRFVLTVQRDEHRNLRFRLIGLRDPLLELTYAEDRSSPDRPLFYITGGSLVGPPVPGDHRTPARLEFRETPDKFHVMAAIFNYRPSLPWAIYRFTQAPVHLIVMSCFGRHLRKLTEQREVGGSALRDTLSSEKFPKKGLPSLGSRIT